MRNGLWVGRNEVTQRQFTALNDVYAGVAYYDGTPGPNSGPDAPAEMVSWNDAADFANRMTVAHNQTYGTTLQERYTC